jgi:hypothetical protein
MTPDQVKMAMAVLGISVRSLAHIVQLSPGTVMRIKFGDSVTTPNVKIVYDYFVEQGIIFIEPTNECEATIAVRR